MVGLSGIEVRIGALIGDRQLIDSVVLEGDKVLNVISDSHQKPSVGGLNDLIYAIGREVEAQRQLFHIVIVEFIAVLLRRRGNDDIVDYIELNSCGGG
jgi:hypothetical protein